MSIPDDGRAALLAILGREVGGPPPLPDDDDPEAALLARRIPRAEIVVGRAYVIHARNGGTADRGVMSTPPMPNTATGAR